mgnify:CR=1 FL=1
MACNCSNIDTNAICNAARQLLRKKFAELHPEWNITFNYGVCSEGDAGKNVTQDPSAAADVYMFANDQLGTLMQANAIARLGGAALDQVKADNSETMVASVTSGEGVYGVPFTGNTWFMYYDKSVYTEEDIKSLDAMMAKAPVAFPVTNTWYMPAFFFANGGTMFGDGTDGAAGITFGGENGAAATGLCEIVEQANLKETSLYHLAMECGIDDPEAFTRRFIAEDQEVRAR